MGKPGLWETNVSTDAGTRLSHRLCLCALSIPENRKRATWVVERVRWCRSHTIRPPMLLHLNLAVRRTGGRGEPASSRWSRRQFDPAVQKMRQHMDPAVQRKAGCGDQASSRFVPGLRDACTFHLRSWALPLLLAAAYQYHSARGSTVPVVVSSQLRVDAPVDGCDADEDEFTPASEMRVQSRSTAAAADRHARRRASVEAEQAALMVRCCLAYSRQGGAY